MTSEHTRFEIRPVLDAPISTAQLLGHSNIIQNLRKFLESDNMITPLSIAVHGDWGSGKTSLMKTLLANLDGNKFDLIFFEAWKFEYSNPALALIGKIVQKYEKDSVAIKNILKSAGMIVANKFLNTDLQQLIDTIRGNTKESDNFSDQLQDIIKKNLKEKNLVIIIDDLDRCDVENCLQILAIMKLFLDIDKVICIVAVDFKRLQQAWRTKYQPSSGSEDDGREYLEKIFQIRIGMPKPPPEQLREYIETLMIGPPNQILDLLSYTAPKNPRAIKKMLNLISYRALILNSDINYESATLWTVLEDIVGNTNTIKICDVLHANGNTLGNLIMTKGDNWKTIKDVFTRLGPTDLVQQYASKLSEFFKYSNQLTDTMSANKSHLDRDFMVLYNATNEALR